MTNRITTEVIGRSKKHCEASDRVPFLDLQAATQEIREELDAALGRVLDSGSFLLGKELEAFEAELAAYVGARHCVGVGNGLDALVLSLKALFVVRSTHREELRKHLEKAGITALIHYPVPAHLQRASQDMKLPAGALPISGKIHEEVLRPGTFCTVTLAEGNFE